MKKVESLNLDKHQKSKRPKYVITDSKTGKVLFTADTEEEFNEKRVDLVKKFNKLAKK